MQLVMCNACIVFAHSKQADNFNGMHWIEQLLIRCPILSAYVTQENVLYMTSQDLLPVAVPGDVANCTENVCAVVVRFTIRNITTAPSDSVTVYVVGANPTKTSASVWKFCVCDYSTHIYIYIGIMFMFLYVLVYSFCL